MNTVVLAIGVLNLIIMLVVLFKLFGLKSQDSGDSKADVRKALVELNDKLVQQKGDIVERINEKNAYLARDTAKQLDELKSGNRDSLDKINETLNLKMSHFQKDVFERFGIIQKSVEEKITTLQVSNEEKLDKMRGVVEEKLEKTLTDRLTLSFESVRKNLEGVQKGLGEMQSLATDVGGLKKAISNVKTRGVFGEIQLERILEEILTPAQYEKNAQVKSASQERVEFAVKLPGKDDDDSTVYLAIDSKFPSEDYESLLAAYDHGEKPDIDSARKAFENKIKLFAREISEKYINPPLTTDFAILFLPFESLYAEVVQTPGLFEELQRKYKVTVTGPTTLSAFLNALQLGFKTLAIEKRSSEVWTVLGAVKTEFGKFEEALGNVQKKLQGADNDLSKLVGTRTNAIKRRLREVEKLSESDTKSVLPIDEVMTEEIITEEISSD